MSEGGVCCDRVTCEHRRQEMSGNEALPADSDAPWRAGSSSFPDISYLQCSQVTRSQHTALAHEWSLGEAARYRAVRLYVISERLVRRLKVENAIGFGEIVDESTSVGVGWSR